LLLSWSATASMGTSLIAALLDVSEDDLIEPLALGVELRLLSSTDNDRYAIHRLLKEIQRELHPIENKEDWAQTTCQRMISWFKERKNEFSALKDYQAEIDHLENWEYLAEKNEWYEAIELMWLQAYPFWHLFEYKKGESILQKALTLFEQTQKEENQNSQILEANLLSDFCSMSKELGKNLCRGLELETKALTIRLTVLGKEHPDTATSYNNIGGTYGALGDHNEALKLQKKALAIKFAVFGGEHPSTATSYGNIGDTYRKLGNHKKALKLEEKALTIRLAVLGEEHLDTATSYNNIGITYLEISNYEKALENHRKSLAIEMAHYYSDSSRILSSLRGIINTLILQNRHVVALDELLELKTLATKDKKIKLELKKLNLHIRKEAKKSGVLLTPPNNKKKPRRR